MTSPHVEKLAMARRWLAASDGRLTAEERALLEEFVRRYPEDPTLTPPDRRRLVREFAFISDRLAPGS